MKHELFDSLWSYLVSNNPNELISVEKKRNIREVIWDKINGIDDLIKQMEHDGVPQITIIEVCMHELTQDFIPSRYQYISEILESEFEDMYLTLVETGSLTYEICNLIEECGDVFNSFSFSVETEDDVFLEYAIIGTIANYLGD
ncbi:DUF1896 domain-containing protein [Chitinophaga varians]|uniref:DUF1896 domain-containing protein n=1 Tax=Chitinophaga varians TaxID=2202339 RepID=A0A847RYP7_9BACT|nr:DUF1896 domain-containing protein [Chitinophaga varians]NLR67906.1 DUF1896 domain-containing protein [Chitinophaga varians]